MKKALGLALAGAALLAAAALLTSAVSPKVHGQSPLGFGIRPANADSGGAYFAYNLVAGSTFEDAAVVVNDGESPVALRLYVADGVTAINGGTAFANAGQDRNGVRAWLATDTSELELAGGQEVRVPFTLSVPPDATPGDHVAGIVVEAPPKGGGGQGVAAAVVERAGVAVVVRVPGPPLERLSVGEMCLNQETGSNYFETPVTNDGNVLTRGEGSLVLTTTDGEEVFNRPVDLDTVLPGDSTLLRMDAPLDPGPGSYVAELSLRQPNGEQVAASSRITIGEEKLNGCLTATAPEERGPQRGGLPSLPGGNFPWLIAGLIALVALLAGALGAREFAWRRRR